MLLETIDWIILISVFLALLAVFYLAPIAKEFPHKLTFPLAIIVIGILMLWGIIRSDSSTLSSWIQAGATLILLVITGMSTYAAIKTAEANKRLAEATIQQSEIARKERMSKMVLEIAHDIFQPVLKILHRNWEYLDGGNEIVSAITSKELDRPLLTFSRHPLFNLEKIVSFNAILRDNTLRDNTNEMFSLNEDYNRYYHKLEKFLNGIYEKQVQMKTDFSKYLTELKPTESQLDIEQDLKNIFGLAIANSKRHDYKGYNFFNEYRSQIIAKLKILGLKKEMEEYTQLKEEFCTLCSRSENLIEKIFLKWKEEYYLTDRDLQGNEIFLSI